MNTNMNMAMSMRNTSRPLAGSRGFTLVEIAITLVALGIILLGAVVFWQQSARERVSAQQQDVQLQAREAVVGFAYAQYRLPCPAADANGVESCAAGGGLRQVGFVPWRTLGLPRPEAGRLRYGVYREANVSTPQDRDLAVATDRMNPLWRPTPSPTPSNNDAPNPNAPTLVAPSAGLLGATQSGNDANPLNAACDATASQPCPLGGAQSVNVVDLCLALNTSSFAVTSPAAQLGLTDAGNRRSVAFAIVAPGLLDADGNGNFFDGANATATDANPTFEGREVPQTVAYDDKVLAVSHTELFAELSCGAGLSTALHSHFATATGAFVLERAFYDYRDQLDVAVALAIADEFAAIASVASAAAGVVDAAQALGSAIADTTMSVGARAFQIGLAAVGVAAAAVATAASVTTLIDAVASRESAEQDHSDFAANTTAMTTLAASINENTLRADAIGF
ncbi:type II secretion system protein [Hydrogenophaga sp. 5NK40-0174]|uniref:type II secretion system protein n=1 Tax=Hydrogenophaga sp. 5NK40-0174 TaxID=3127649 RepID=UPI00310A401B